LLIRSYFSYLILKGQGGDYKKMGKLISFLFNLARRLNDVSKVASGDLKKMTRRVKNKVIGRKLILKIW